MTRRATRGFTIVEMLVAIVILTIGVLAIGSGAMASTRNLHRSRLATVGATQAQGKMDELLSYAAATATPCTAANFASSVSPVTSSQVALSWNVPTTGSLRTVRVFARYRLAGSSALRTDTLMASVAC